MNKIVNTFLLIGDKVSPELHLKQSWFTYRACGPFTKRCQRIQKLRKTGSLKHLFENKLNKFCFTHDAAYSDSKDLPKKNNLRQDFKKYSLWNC